jgi:DHA2 family multidrug resistance protein-like MFS transporter
MLSLARLLGQTLGAAAVAILFRAHGLAGARLALLLAAALAFTGALVSAVRLTAHAARGAT